MRITHSQLSVPGPVRDHNEDFVAFWRPASVDLERAVGIAAILADGVGGESRGELASQLAVTAVVSALEDTKQTTDPEVILRTAFDSANKSVYDVAMSTPEQGVMSTTMTVSLLRDNSLYVGYIGDSRVYLVRNGSIRCVTTDHSLVSLSVKFRLMHEHRAMTSPMRSMLTRAVGHDPIVKFDTERIELAKGDVIIQCSDGLYAFATNDEILEIATHYNADEACKRLVALAERRQVDDNLSVQIIRIEEIDLISFFRGVAIYKNEQKAPVSDELAPGQILDDRFETLELVNRSGMAMIFKARDLKSGEIVALKVPFMQFESDVSTFTRFQREEEIGLLLNHPYILKIIPTEKAKSRPYLAMEFLEGETLDTLMARTRPLPEKEAASICSRICEALEHMHNKNIVHRDLKPQNVMVCKDGSIRIIDFGIAKAAKMRRLTFVGFSPTMGTPDYMAPEQVNGRRGDHRTDIYSLGAILYEMVTGKVPFEGESPYVVMNARTTGDPEAPRKLNGHLSPVMEEIVLHALSRNPEDRYESAAQMRAELDDYEKVELVGRYRNLKPAKIWKSRFRMLPFIILFILAQVGIFGAMFWYFAHHGRH